MAKGITATRSKASSLLSFRLLVAGIFLYTLEAYSLGPVPFSWVSNIALIFSALFVFRGGRIRVPFTPVALLFFYFGVGCFSGLWYVTFHPRPEMPSLATSSYPAYIALRMISVIAFISGLISAYAIARSGQTEKLIESHLKILGFVFISTLYLYIAQISGAWEPPRNRAGTGGQDFSSSEIRFSYLFHRALGTFREPSHMAEFVAATVFLVISRLISIRSAPLTILFFIAFAFCLLLSGSFLGLMSFSAGFMVLLLSGKKRPFVISFGIFFTALSALAAANAFLGVDFLAAIIPRINSLINFGVSGTNRVHIYEAAMSLPTRAFGYGFGNASLLISEISSNDLVVSVLNLFLAILLDTGPLGLVAVLIVFLAPLVHYFRSYQRDPVFVYALAAHVSWMVSSFGRIPELNPMHGIVLGILFGLMYASSRGGRHA